jgi:hypothetical protein
MGATSPGAHDDLPRQLRIAFDRGGEMGRRMRELDWTASPLGPPNAWPEELRYAVAAMFASRAQIIIFFGPQYCALYNDAYIVSMGSKHPAHLGRPGQEMWTEAWSVLQELFDGVRERDTAFFATDFPFMIERYGFLEETYFDISYDPIRSGGGEVSGINCIVSESTYRVLGSRRVRTLSALGSRLADSPDEASLVAETAAVFGENAADVPFARLILDPAGMPDPVQAVAAGGPAAVLPLREVAEPPPAAAEHALVFPVGTGTAGSSIRSSSGPRISVRGVRNSWLTFEKKLVLAWSSAASAAARSRSVSYARMLVTAREICATATSRKSR